MDQDKIGKFIFDLRKKNSLTQAQLAEKLNITSQAVSKWENGRGIPDIELLKKISDEFNVDISDILNGKNYRKKKSNKMLIISLILVILFGSVYFVFHLINDNKKGYNYSNLSSENSLFVLKGVAIYNDSKKSIFISNVDYVGEEKEEKYLNVESSLYETNGNVEKKISQYGDIDGIDNNFSTSLSDFLSKVEFNIDDYDSTCKELTSNSLYIVINAKNSDKKIITYKIPIKLDENCIK